MGKRREDSRDQLGIFPGVSADFLERDWNPYGGWKLWNFFPGKISYILGGSTIWAKLEVNISLGWLVSFCLFWLHCGACRILTPWPGIEPISPAVEMQQGSPCGFFLRDWLRAYSTSLPTGVHLFTKHLLVIRSLLQRIHLYVMWIPLSSFWFPKFGFLITGFS